MTIWNIDLPIHRRSLTFVAAVVDVAAGKEGQITALRIDVEADCSLVVDPDRARAQCEDPTIMTLGDALRGTVTVNQGEVEEANLGDYLASRQDVTLEARVPVVESGAAGACAGEPAVSLIASAIRNATYASTELRIRALLVRPRMR